MQRVVIAIVGVLVLSPILSAQASQARTPAPTVVKVTIFGQPLPTVAGKILFNPKTVKQGTVVFKITNTDNEWHKFEIDNLSSRLMGPNGGKGVLRVTFKKRGLYFAATPEKTDFGISGVLTVTAATGT